MPSGGVRGGEDVDDDPGHRGGLSYRLRSFGQKPPVSRPEGTFGEPRYFVTRGERVDVQLGSRHDGRSAGDDP